MGKKEALSVLHGRFMQGSNPEVDGVIASFFNSWVTVRREGNFVLERPHTMDSGTVRVILGDPELAGRRGYRSYIGDRRGTYVLLKRGTGRTNPGMFLRIRECKSGD